MQAHTHKTYINLKKNLYVCKKSSTFAVDMFRSVCISIFCLLTMSLWADNITGLCGDSLLWSFDTETHHLEITGKGKMNLDKYPAWTNKNITIASVSFPDSITSIDSYAFEEQELIEVVIPASVKQFGREAFAQMPSLLRFEYEGEGYAKIEERTLHNCYNLRYFKGITNMLSYNDALDTLIVTYGYASTNFKLSYIDNTHAYDKRLSGRYDTVPKNIKTFFLPDELEEIGKFLLCYATELDGITIPKKVHTIKEGAFLNCTSLDSLVFDGDGVQSIGDSAFCRCTSLSYISLHDTIPPVIHARTFEGVDHSIPVYIPQNATERYHSAPYWSEFFHFIEPLPPTTAIESVPDFPDESSNSSDFSGNKYLHGNEILIFRNGSTYTITGQKR